MESWVGRVHRKCAEFQAFQKKYSSSSLSAFAAPLTLTSPNACLALFSSNCIPITRYCTVAQCSVARGLLCLTDVWTATNSWRWLAVELPAVAYRPTRSACGQPVLTTQTSIGLFRQHDQGQTSIDLAVRELPPACRQAIFQRSACSCRNSSRSVSPDSESS